MEIEAETRRDPSVDEAEIRHFEALSQEWWDETGKFRGLHAFNPARVAFIAYEVRRWRGGKGGRPLEGLAVLDIGCGGGILSEPLARLGGAVVGVDPVADSIAVASQHARRQGLSIHYRVGAAEDVAAEGTVFDVVIASEVVEHVADLPSFLRTCRALAKPGGLTVISTLNRTAKSYGLAILAAERLVRLIPRGTHDWRKFIRPEELEGALREAGFKLLRASGIVFRPLHGTWELSPKDLGINYIVSAEAV